MFKHYCIDRLSSIFICTFMCQTSFDSFNCSMRWELPSSFTEGNRLGKERTTVLGSHGQYLVGLDVEPLSSQGKFKLAFL